MRGIENVPAVARFIFSNVQLFFAAFWILSGATLGAAIGLLRRKNWARIFFVCLFAFGIVWNLGGIWLQHEMLSSFSPLPSNAPKEFADQFQAMATTMSIAAAVFVMAVSVLLAWLIKRMLSRPIRAEFNALSQEEHRKPWNR